jgi:hypothetical protein
MFLFSLIYGFLARGYGFQCLFFVVASFSVYNIVKDDNRTKDWVAFALASTLAFYTLPAFLYAFILLNLVLLVFNIRGIMHQIKYGAVITISTVLLYLPIFIINGVQSVTSNHYSKRLPRAETIHRFGGFIWDVAFDITGIPGVHLPLVALLTVGVIYSAVQKRGSNILLYVIFLISPILILIAQSVIPPTRTFSYYAFIIVFLIVLPWTKQVEGLKKYYLMPGLLIIQLILLYNFNSRMEILGPQDKTVHQMCLKIGGNKKYLSADYYFGYYLQYELTTHGFKDAAITSYSEIDPPISADTISGYDYIIIEKKRDRTQFKKPLEVNNYYSVY